MTIATPGRIRSRRVPPSLIVALATQPDHLLEEQRDHVRRTLQKRKSIYGVLQGRQQEFAAVLIRRESRLVLCDGYLRGNALAAGEVIADKDFPFYLRTHVVDSREEANVLFEQYNNLSADKKFETALREARAFGKVTSGLVKSRGRASAALQAAGLKSGTRVKEATHAVLPGILRVDGYGLARESHEFSGSLAAYFAIAQHAPPHLTQHAEQFVRLVNAGTPISSRKVGAVALNSYIAWLKGVDAKTGGAANVEAFQRGLYAAAEYLRLRARRTLAPLQALAADRTLTLPAFLAVLPSAPRSAKSKVTS